ncbi:hypothetical protein Slin15195_G054070 [Septoria linicola]|uniref:Uncharacterized protein n=1 Tax=Septoria linicola TaxID=215465 RepID=A0A9Q9ARY7_9PEZI|nr:hypothetical protein Slin15195_G054070 [Septoria linicola]
MLNADPDPRNASAAWSKTPVQASECALYYCVKVYNTSVTNNTATQLAQELTTNRAADSWQPISVDVNEIGTDQTIIDSLEQGGLQGAINHTDLMIGNDFNVSQRAVMSTSQYFQSTFARNLSIEESSSHRSVDGNPMTGYYLDDDTEEGAHDPSIMQPLFRGRTDLPQLFENIAASMTNAIRTSDQCVEQHFGKLGRQVTKYRVQWPWIALPAAIVLASLVQLLITILSSRTRPLWKSSTLATPSRGPYVAEVFDGAMTNVELTDAAGKHDVDLFPREKKSRDQVSLLSTQDGQPK